ncbi:CZB domain-containing protein [Shewanella avicenniae]
MQHVIGNSATIAFLTTTKLDHAVWKNHVYHLIERQDMHETVNTHKDCRLGDWYYRGAGADNFDQLRGFRELEAPHKLVHDAGAKALNARRNGNIAEMVRQLKTMEEASLQVVRAIDQVIVNATR